jgi:hypothetical protein
MVIKLRRYTVATVLGKGNPDEDKQGMVKVRDFSGSGIAVGNDNNNG